MLALCIPVWAVEPLVGTHGSTLKRAPLSTLMAGTAAAAQTPGVPATPENLKRQPGAVNTDKPPQVLTLADAIRLARQNSPHLRGANAVYDRAEAATRTAGAYINPSVEVFEGKQAARQVRNPGAPGLLQHYAAYQTLEIPSERKARKRAAELARISTRYAAETVQFGVVAEAKHAFYGVLRQREEVRQALENLGLVQDLRRRVEVEVSTGEKGRLELTRAEAELARANFMVSSARINLVNAMAQLRVAIAAPASANLDPEGSLEPPVKLDTLDQLRAKVLQIHPALEQARTDVEQAQAVLTHERTLRIPQPTFFGEFERQPDLTFWRAGVTIPVPIWNRRQGQIAESQAAIRQMEADRDRRTLEINAALERAYEQYQLADEQTKSLESGSLHEAQSAVEAAKAAYRFGERGIVEVLDAQRVLQSVRGDLLDAQYARQSALVDLEELGAVTPGGKQ
jgi:cobalt-zinc-cadmium efflux system outer membrane protein